MFIPLNNFTELIFFTELTVSLKILMKVLGTKEGRLKLL